MAHLLTVPSARPVVPHWRRIGLTVWVLALSWCSWALYATQSTEPFLAWVWPSLFGFAVVTMLACMAYPGVWVLYFIAGGASVVAWASRCALLAYKYILGHDPASRYVLGIVGYASVAFFFGWWWLAKVMPWHKRHEVGVILRGD